MADAPVYSPVIRLAPQKKVGLIRDSMSAVALHGKNLWVGGDEGSSVHRFSTGAGPGFGEQRSFDLALLLQLPSPDAEIDIEGMDVAEGYLWLVGSHSLKRKKPKRGDPDADNIKRMAKLESDGNRFTLGRVPIVPKGDEFGLATSFGSLSAARLKGNGKGNKLTQALAKDPHLAAYVPSDSDTKGRGIPGKDNGLDVEGIAASGNQVFLGLRGPVLRGWAIVLEVVLEDAGSCELRLASYKKHFLQLQGLGVRDLVLRGEDLLILAGPTMDLDGPVHVFCWHEALRQKKESVVWRDKLPIVLTIPYGVGSDAGKDHPEGMTCHDGADQLLVCYDSPAEARLDGEDGVRADVFRLPAT